MNDYKAIAALSPANNFIAGTTNMASILGTGNDGKSLYNGNISSMVTTILDPDQINTPLPQLTAYKYDQLNRITKLDAYRNINPATNSWTDASTNGTYQERYSYDANGNIKTLSRNGNIAGALEMDRLSYTYEGPALGAQYKKKTNRLNRVNDNATSGASYNTDIENQALDNYSYDAIGNLTKDNQEEIAEIKWTVYGKVSEVIRTFSSSKPNLEFRYDAMGNRVMKIVKPTNSLTNPSGWIKTYYVRDATGNVMSTYEEVPTINDGHYSLAEQHIYGSSRVGMLSDYKDLISLDMPAENTYIRILGEKRYEGSNHLGNVLTILSDKRTGVDLSKPGLIQSSDYYAFGMAMPGRMFISSAEYRYGFNGQEHEDELAGDYFYEYRIHDPRIGRFLSVDPLTAKYPYNSTYAFAENKVISAIELEGLEAVNLNTDKVDNTLSGDNLIGPIKSNKDFTPWQDLISFLPSNATMEAADERVAGLEPQPINEAYGDELNLDYYSLTITNLPNGFSTSEELFDYVRKNFNQFTTGSGTSFGPFNDDESSKFNSSNPTSAVMQFSVGNLDDLSVITSKYGSNYWVFSPVFTLADLAHPVSGNRQFGLVKSLYGPSTFYTRGADRPWGLIDAMASSKVFEGADKLWSTVMNNVAAYINANGGAATINPTITKRISWSKDYLAK